MSDFSYKRQTATPDSARFKRWLVMIDALPDMGAVGGYNTIAAPHRTISVVDRSSIQQAANLLHNSAKLIRRQQHGHQLVFCLLDLATQTAVTRDQLDTWASLHSVVPPVGIPPGVFFSEVEHAASLVRPVHPLDTNLADGLDPFVLLRNRALLPLTARDPLPANTLAENSYDPLRKMISDREYNDAIQAQLAAGHRDWVLGLAGLAGSIGTAIDTEIANEISLLTNAALASGVPQDSPRVSSISAVVERLAGRWRSDLVAMAYKRIIDGRLDYTAPGAVDRIIHAGCAGVWDTLPSYLHPLIDAIPAAPAATG